MAVANEQTSERANENDGAWVHGRAQIGNARSSKMEIQNRNMKRTF